MIIPFPNSSVSLAADRIITQSADMRKLIGNALKAAKSSATILITGESGTGKELFSRLIHESSSRSQQEFVSVNCASLPDNLIESELFGHEKGSFTDAFQQRIGRFEYAHQGTLLLDEVTEVPMTTQAKLLRTLEEYEIQRIGSNKTIPVDVRVVATSNRQIQDQIDARQFRMDLYYRLNVIQICVPALRERVIDIPLLANYFIEQFKRENAITIKGLTKSALEFLKQYPWPGNIRELRNSIHRACVLSPKPMIDVECFQSFLEDESHDVRDETQEIPDYWTASPLAETERKIILAAIQKHGTQKLAADYLGITSRTLSNKLKLYRGGDDFKLRVA